LRSFQTPDKIVVVLLDGNDIKVSFKSLTLINNTMSLHYCVLNGERTRTF
jgi:hypothetical protein